MRAMPTVLRENICAVSSSRRSQRWRQGEGRLAEWLEIIDILTHRLQMARWQMESLSVKKNGSEGVAALFLPPLTSEYGWPSSLGESSATTWSISSLSLFTRDVEEDQIMPF